MKILVTGGTGFIGSHLVDALIEEGDHELRCLIRKDEKWLQGKRYQRVTGDLFDLDVLKQALEGIDTLFHIAAIVKAPSWQKFVQANVDATETLVRLAQRAGVKRIVVLSSLAGVGPSKGSPVDEKTAMNPVSMYGKSKKVMEESLQRLANSTSGITVIRPPAVYGPREENIYSFFKSCNKRICPIIGNGKKPLVSMVYVKDLVRGILQAAEYQHTGLETFFISSEELYDWNTIKDTTSKVLNKKLLPLYVNSGIVKQIGTINETVASLFGQFPILNREKALELSLEWTCSVEKAKQAFHYSQLYTLEEGISETIYWYKKHHWL